MRNVEIKAKISDYKNFCKLAEKLSGEKGLVRKQEDIFYKVNVGRMKMRFTDDSGTLVQYERDNINGPKLSNYSLICLSVETGKEIDELLRKSVGFLGRVLKERKIYIIGQTRVHIDRVEDLGDFMELEVVLEPDQTVEEGKQIAKDLQEKFGVKDEDLIDCAYIDILNK